MISLPRCFPNRRSMTRTGSGHFVAIKGLSPFGDGARSEFSLVSGGIEFDQVVFSLGGVHWRAFHFRCEINMIDFVRSDRSVDCRTKLSEGPPLCRFP